MKPVLSKGPFESDALPLSKGYPLLMILPKKLNIG